MYSREYIEISGLFVFQEIGQDEVIGSNRKNSTTVESLL